MTKAHQNIIQALTNVCGKTNVITSKWAKQSHTKGWRYGQGSALAVTKPESLIQMWKLLKVCISKDVIVIMQAANTGLTGGSTPYGKGYDRPIIIINTLRINTIHSLNNGHQAVSYTHLTLPTTPYV